MVVLNDRGVMPGQVGISEKKKAFAVFLKEELNWSYRTIAARCKISKSSEERIFKQGMEGKAPTKRSGRPPILSARDRGRFIRKFKSFGPKTRKISLIKTLVHRALMICSKTKLGSELDKIKQLLIENGYPADVLLSCINQKLANFAAEKTFGPEWCPVYLKLPWIGTASSKFENQINKAIKSCFYAAKPRVVCSTRAMLPSAKKDSVPTTQKSCVVYEFSCRCEARYVGRTTQRLADRIKQHVPTSIRKKSNTVREQLPRLCKNNSSKINCESAIGQHLLTNPECTKTYTDDNFWIIVQARSPSHLSVLEFVSIKTQNPVLCKQKDFIFSLGIFK